MVRLGPFSCSAPGIGPRARYDGDVARTEEELYDAYLDRCLAGDVESPDRFLTGYPELGGEARARIETLYRLYRSAAQAQDCGNETRAHDGIPESVGEFRILSLLGEGGMGRVYLAEQESLGRRVALKMIRPDLLGSSTTVERFRREARAAARLTHPHIAQVHEVGDDYIAMELVEGQNLDKLSARPKWRQAAGWARALADALQHAHDHGIVHRDVKPSNIRLAADGRPLLLDFGIARDAEATAGLTQTYAGSPLYSAPEQIMGHDIDARVDVYGLGVVLYELLTGRTPFAGGSIEQVVRRILIEEPVAPRKLDPSLPRDLDTVVQKAIAKEPRARYASARAFADDLTAVLDDAPIRARPPGPLKKTLRWIRRHPAAAMALTALLLGAAIFGVQRWRAARERAGRAQDMVARADALGEELRQDWSDSRKFEGEVAVLESYIASKHLDHDEERRLLDGRAEVRRLQLARSAKFHRALEMLHRARQLDTDVKNVRAVRARLYKRRSQVENNPVTRRFWKDRARREDPQLDLGYGEYGQEFSTDPPGAEVFLWRFLEEADVVPGGSRRRVPVPWQGDPVLSPATWALRVVDRPWWIVKLAGHPIRDAVLVLRGNSKVATGDRLLQIDDVPVRAAWDAHHTEGSVFRFQHAGDVRGESLAVLGIEVGAPEALAARGGVEAQVWRNGGLVTITLPKGLALRPTATPLLPTKTAYVGKTPLRIALPSSSLYVALFRHADCRNVRVMLGSNPLELPVRLPPAEAAPAGFVHVAERGEPFWIMEREVTCAEYLAFINEAPGARGKYCPHAPHNEAQGGFWPKTSDGRYRLPDTWRPRWPVLGISFDDAEAFVAWRNRATPAGMVYALPTYAEWLRAGQGLGSWAFAFGNVFWPRWTNSNFSRAKPGPEPVMSYPTDCNPRGIYDMTGSVQEWLATPYPSNPDFRRLGGGSWASAKPSEFRLENGLGAHRTRKATQFGFRLVLRRRP